MKRWLLIAAFGLLLPGCGCLTNRIWNSVSLLPEQVTEAEITSADVLRMAVLYENGETWLVDAEAGRPFAGQRDSPSRRIRRLEHGLDRTPGARTVKLRVTAYGDKYNNRNPHVILNEGAWWLVVDLPEPVSDWGAASTWGAVVATPATMVVDLVTAPVMVLWIIGTAGGHGHPWVPWCEYR